MKTPSSHSMPCYAAGVPHVHLRDTPKLLQLVCLPRREPGASHKQLPVLPNPRLSAGAAPVFVVTQMDPRETPKFEPPHQLAVQVAKLLLCSVDWHTGVQLIRLACSGGHAGAAARFARSWASSRRCTSSSFLPRTGRLCNLSTSISCASVLPRSCSAVYVCGLLDVPAPPVPVCEANSLTTCISKTSMRAEFESCYALLQAPTPSVSLVQAASQVLVLPIRTEELFDRVVWSQPYTRSKHGVAIEYRYHSRDKTRQETNTTLYCNRPSTAYLLCMQKAYLMDQPHHVASWALSYFHCHLPRACPCLPLLPSPCLCWPTC